MESRKWRKLLRWEETYWCRELLGKWFWFANNELCGEHPKQFKFKSFCPECYSTFWVSKRWSSFNFSQILGASSPWTIVKSFILLWLHTLVLAGGTWYLEWVTVPLFMKSITRFNFVNRIWSYVYDNRNLCIWRAVKATDLCCLIQGWRDSAENWGKFFLM